jgi:hypothetical protein
MEKQAHLIHVIKHGIEEMPPLARRKEPVLAFVAGFVLGAVGIGLYLQSFKDFAICMLAALSLLIVLAPTVVGEIFGLPLGFLLAAIYGAYRASTSNRKLASLSKNAPPAPPKQVA